MGSFELRHWQLWFGYRVCVCFRCRRIFTLAGKGACFQQIGLVINAGEGLLAGRGEGQPMARMHLFEGFGFFAALNTSASFLLSGLRVERLRRDYRLCQQPQVYQRVLRRFGWLGRSIKFVEGERIGFGNKSG